MRSTPLVTAVPTQSFVLPRLTDTILVPRAWHVTRFRSGAAGTNPFRGTNTQKSRDRFLGFGSKEVAITGAGVSAEAGYVALAGSFRPLRYHVDLEVKIWSPIAAISKTSTALMLL